jgi:hypothetical protein
MTQEDKELLKIAMQFVESKYPSDCPYYVQLVGNAFNELKDMKQEDKELLLKDLCARLPYGVKMNHIADDEHSPKTLIGVAKDMITLEGLGGYECVDVEDYKPYLFPLSSMAEEERMVIGNEFAYGQPQKAMDILHKRHIDYRGLIEKGLAIDATGLNIY